MPDLESGEAHSSATAQDFVKEKPGSGKKGDPPALGFPGLAKQIAQDPDQETFVFRKFNRLTAWSLVFTENELASLEDKLGRLEDAMLGDRIAMRSAKDWAQFETRAKDESTTEYKIMDLTHKISAKLAQYHEALSSASNIAHLTQPSTRVVDVLSDMKKNAKLEYDLSIDQRSNRFARWFKRLRHPGIESKRKKDLVALKVSSDNDFVTRWLRDHWPRFLTGGSDLHTDNARFFQDSFVTAITSTLSVLLAVGLLVGSILGLHFVEHIGVRLGLLMMFIVIFAFGVALTTGAKRDSIFASTAAYAAVLIVFISGDLTNTGKP